MSKLAGVAVLSDTGVCFAHVSVYNTTCEVADMAHNEPAWWVQRPWGAVLMTKTVYYNEFGSTREERADNMKQSGQNLELAPGRPGVWKAPSQAMQIAGEYTVREYQGRMCSCTCPDFKRYSVYDDLFACKHMLMA